MKAAYNKARRKKVLFAVIMAVASVAVMIYTFGVGNPPYTIAEVLEIIRKGVNGEVLTIKENNYIWEGRVPRAIGAIVVGAGLAVCGAIMQNNMRNPLADPYTMGISSGAFLGAVLSMGLGFSIIPGLTGLAQLQTNAFLFSLLPVLLIVGISKWRNLTPTAMILLGVALMYVFSSISQVIILNSTEETLDSAYSWRVGSVANLKWSDLAFMTPVVLVGTVVFWFLARKLDVMYAGDRGAQTLGVNPLILRLVTLLIASFMVAAIVCYTGTIGFVGLVAPHVARIFVGSANRYLIPSSALFGAAFLVAADTIAKVSGPLGLPVGVISSMVGGPLFLYILIKQRKSAW